MVRRPIPRSASTLPDGTLLQVAWILSVGFFRPSSSMASWALNEKIPIFHIPPCGVQAKSPWAVEFISRHLHILIPHCAPPPLLGDPPSPVTASPSLTHLKSLPDLQGSAPTGKMRQNGGWTRSPKLLTSQRSGYSLISFLLAVLKLTARYVWSYVLHTNRLLQS